MSVQIIGMIAPQEASETISRKGPAVDSAYVRAFAQAHEHAGFDRILVPASATSPDPLLTVAYAAAHTQHIKFLLAHRPGFVSPTLAARQ
ncbi:MAG: LLM class flavin-dependent oxidoreductase, partial [Comamonas sp.]